MLPNTDFIMESQAAVYSSECLQASLPALSVIDGVLASLSFFNELILIYGIFVCQTGVLSFVYVLMFIL